MPPLHVDAAPPLALAIVCWSAPFAAFAAAKPAGLSAHDGFLKNPDGSYTLSVRAFQPQRRHRRRPSRPAPTIRSRRRPAIGMQPTTFCPAIGAAQCVMVVPADFDGKMKWTLDLRRRHRPAPAKRDAAVELNLFDREGGARARQTGFREGAEARVPEIRRRRCACSASPRVRNNSPTLSVAVNEELNLFGSAHDEASAARQGASSSEWKVLKGPGTWKFTICGSARTKAIFSAPGSMN